MGLKGILSAGMKRGDGSAAGLVAELAKLRETTNVSMPQLIGEFGRLAAGPGAISPKDFLALRLFDKEFRGSNDAREFVGDQRFAELCYTVNYRHDWISVLSDKVVATAYLEAYKIPTIPIAAIYMPGVAPVEGVLTSKQEIEEFLSHADRYPLFGKPVGSQNSLGSVALADYSDSDRSVATGDGRVQAEALAEEIVTKYSSGYIFQDLIAPHSSIEELCGKRLACVRFLTILTQDGPQVFRVCWKIPVGNHMADNYWREGNLLAQLDGESGRVLRAVSGKGPEMREHADHPDTKTPLVGFQHPQWEEMKALALEGAALMRNVPLIGWDIACTDHGPVIVEMNECPDAFISQFAERRGLLDSTFNAFVAFQKKNAESFNAAMAAKIPAA